MKKYIDANAFLDDLCKRFERPDAPEISVSACLLISCMLECFPAADVAPVVRGTWEPCDIMLDHVPDSRTVKCSECGYLMATERGKSGTPYCPHCGARMYD